VTAEVLLMVVACGLYVAASGLAVHRLVRAAPSRGRGMAPLLSAAAVCLVAVLALRGLRLERIPAFGIFEALVWYGLSVTLAYLCMAVRHDTRGVSGILLPFVTVVVIGSLAGMHTQVVADAQIQTAWLGLHIAAAFVGYGMFTLESFLAIAYLIQDRNLKRKRFGRVFHRLPPLEALDQLMHEQIGFAFLMFSLSIVLGVFLTHRFGWGTLWTTDPKVAGAAATWLVYAILFHLRLTADRHGRRMAMVALAGLACVLVTFLGVHLMTSSIHDFISPK